MKKIKITALKLTNFKGIRSLNLDSLSDETYIYGDNGVGKTSIFDAFTWLLFGKDSTDRKDFEVKTLDKHNNVIHKIDHEVEAVLDVDGEKITLRRILREDWVKKRGTTVAEFNGNKTTYEWNGVPMNASEYTNKINSIIDEKVFKMITNPAAFNGLKWQDQRDVLITMSGNITDEDVAAGNNDFESLMKKLVGKSFDEYKKQLRSSILKSKKELQLIPTRIDEVERSKPDALDFKAIGEELTAKEKELEAVNDQITDQLKAQQVVIDQKSEIRKQIQDLEHKVNDIDHDYRIKAKDQVRNQNSGSSEVQRKYNEKESELTTASNALGTLKSKLESKKKELTQLSENIVRKRSEWNAKNEEPVNVEIDTCCPTCKQELPSDNIDAKKAEMQKRLNEEKESALKYINQQGKGLKDTLDATTKERDDIQARLDKGFKIVEDLNAELTELEHQLKSAPKADLKSEEEIYTELISNDTQIEKIKKEVTELQEKFDNLKGADVSDLKDKRETLRTEVQHLQLKLQGEKEIEKHNKRIAELSTEETNLAQSIADLEGELFIMEAFEKEKSTRIEESVNSRFNLVNFKLFETQINGAEVPTCKALIEGVPFSDANTASKINAGIDIINTLCMHYKASAPVFIDNRESVVDLIPTESQIINLIVSEEDKKLRVADRPMSYSEHVFQQKLETQTA